MSLLHGVCVFRSVDLAKPRISIHSWSLMSHGEQAGNAAVICHSTRSLEDVPQPAKNRRMRGDQ